MALFRPVSPKKISPAEFRAFQHGLFCGRCFFLVDHSILGRKNPLVLIRAALFSLCGFLPGFPFEFMYFIVQKSVVFIDIPPDCIQHKFLVYLFCRTVMKPAKFIVFFYVPKVAFCLYRADLAVQDPFFALNVGMGFFLQFLPALIDFHDLIFPCIFFGIIFI